MVSLFRDEVPRLKRGGRTFGARTRRGNECTHLIIIFRFPNFQPFHAKLTTLLRGNLSRKSQF
jgi:hypothetical protein